MRKGLFTLLLLCLSLGLALAQTMPMPKREMRGAWIQAVNGQFQGMSRAEMQQNLTNQLNVLAECGVNTIMFQVRVEGDALYESRIEPWSRYLTGQQGLAPSPRWDPLAWMVEQCHRRGMELHAWINPYRAKTKGTTELASTHPYCLHPERFFEYDGLYIFDPGVPENRDYICRIAADIVSRYDVDGLHIDDYFYPYPVAGLPIPDDGTFARYGGHFASRDDWRRNNVNLLIKQLHETLRMVKPWVKFGVSPFGIYHNADGSNIPGSQTRGLQNYDQLYADVLLWVKNGWIDYNVPQLYWQIGHTTADYATLVRWWAAHASERPLVIGQDVERTVKYADVNNPGINQMPAKFLLQRTTPGVAGSCLWYSAAVVRNEGGYASVLKKYYHRTLALQPSMPFITDNAPRKVKKMKVKDMPDGRYLFWQAGKSRDWTDTPTAYAVYRFPKGAPQNLDDSSALQGITRFPLWKLPEGETGIQYYYIVTALNRIQNESAGAKKKVKF